MQTPKKQIGTPSTPPPIEQEPPPHQAPRPVPELESGAEAGLPPALRNWQVIEIDGVATPVPDPMPQPASVDEPADLIQDRPDDLLVAALNVRQITVEAGETAVFHLMLLNNGDHHASFEVRVEGWLDEQWVKIVPVAAMLDGSDCSTIWLRRTERRIISLTITPPQVPMVLAGAHDLAVVVRSPQYPDRVHRLGARLVVQPYTDLALGPLPARPLVTSWRRPFARLRLPITNRSNYAATIYVHGHAPKGQCQIEFLRSDQKPEQSGRSTFNLAAGAKANLLIRVTPRRRSLIGLHNKPVRLHFTAGVVKAQRPPLTVNVELTTLPLFGPKRLLALFGLFLFGLAGSALVAASTALLALRPAPELAVADQASVNPPVVAIVLNLNQSAPTAAPPIAQSAIPLVTGLPLRSSADLPPAQLLPDPALPVVRLDQVSAPGAPAPTAVSASIPAPFKPQQSTVTTVQSANMTYQQLFQEAALRYDLNWRMLAAQAYVESSFDSLALGNSGALGLMQIMPPTWREWSPVVNASDPFDAYSSVLVASAYLDHLRTQLGQKGYPQQEWMLVAYNWGVDKVNEHLEAGRGWDDLPAESRQYALDVLRIAETIPVN